jgi:shikimate kinase
LLRTPDPKATLARLEEERRASYAEAHIHIRSGIQGHGEVVDKIIDALEQYLGA